MPCTAVDTTANASPRHTSSLSVRLRQGGSSDDAWSVCPHLLTSNTFQAILVMNAPTQGQGRVRIQAPPHKPLTKSCLHTSSFRILRNHSPLAGLISHHVQNAGPRCRC